MRKAFAKTLLEIMDADDRVILLTADLGFMVWDDIIEKHPNRFINVGVAEQNMIGIATGLAEAGFIPFAYSIVTFAVLRPYEFIRNGPVLHHLPVRIVGIGGGYEYGSAGITHHGLEDIGLMRMQPGMTVIAPADSSQASTALRKSYQIRGPVYYRIGKNDHAVVKNLDGKFDLKDLQIIRQGNDILFLSMGSITTEVVNAAELLAKKGIESTIAVMTTIKPAPTKALVEILSQFSSVITVEAHYKTGGIGSLISEVIAENQLTCKLYCRHVPDEISKTTGNQEFYDKLYKLDATSLADYATCIHHTKPIEFSNLS